MKTFIIILAVSATVFLIVQAILILVTNKTEGHNYIVVEDYSTFEIRQYEPAIFSYTVMETDSYQTVSGKGFSILAGYIFGKNEKNEKIAMTSPVTMDMDDSITMKFKVPKGIAIEDLPQPTSSKVRFLSEPEKTIAAIQFSGWSSDEKIAKYKNKLKGLLAQNNIEHTGKFSFLGYNPPYELINRRNEIVVEIITK